MKRRDFLKMTAAGAAVAMPVGGAYAQRDDLSGVKRAS